VSTLIKVRCVAVASDMSDAVFRRTSVPVYRLECKLLHNVAVFFCSYSVDAAATEFYREQYSAPSADDGDTHDVQM